MFLNAPGNPNWLKRTVYLSAALILGVPLSLILCSLIEIGYLRWFAISSQGASFSGGGVILSAFQAGLLALGAVGGFFLGRFWWWKVYIERSWAKKYSAGKNK